MDKKNKHYDIRKIFEQMELDLISSMHRAFYFHKKEELKEGFKFEQWQLSKLRALEEYRKRNKKLVESYNKPIQDAIDHELKGNYRKGQGKVSKLINKVKAFISFPTDIAPKEGIREYFLRILKTPIAPKETNFFGSNDKKLNALQEVVTNDLKKAQTSVLRKMDDVYRQTIYKANVYMQSGAKTLNQAIDMATKDFLEKGINSITYSDGKCVNVASYAEMVLRTANHRATLLGEGSKRDEFGVHLVVVSAHANTCKLCAPWQGEVLIDDIFSHPSKEYIQEYNKKYKLLNEAVDKGLLHPNCRHSITTFFEGITKVPQVPNTKNAVETYEAEQKQRAYERAIRKYKRMREGSCDEENLKMANDKLAKYQRAMHSLLKEHPELRRNLNREKADIRSIEEINNKADLKQYNKYKEILGKESPKSLKEFQELKYNNSEEWSLVKDYVKSRENNMISAFTPYSQYKEYKRIINSDIVGLTTSNGIKITGQSKHFIERVFGTNVDPKTNRPRSGVGINDIKDALLNGSVRIRESDPNSIKFITDKCIVTVNPNTGVLIQTNP